MSVRAPARGKEDSHLHSSCWFVFPAHLSSLTATRSCRQLPGLQVNCAQAPVAGPKVKLSLNAGHGAPGGVITWSAGAAGGGRRLLTEGHLPQLQWVRCRPGDKHVQRSPETFKKY